MIFSKELMLEIGAALATAKVVDAKFDETGYGEICLETYTPDFYDFTFSFYDGNIALSEIENWGKTFTEEDRYLLDRDIEWCDILNGRLLEICEEQYKKHEGGEYYDFINQQYKIA